MDIIACQREELQRVWVEEHRCWYIYFFCVRVHETEAYDLIRTGNERAHAAIAGL